MKADVVLDPVGGEVFSRSLATLNPLGAVVALGFAGGWWEPLDPAPLVGRNLGIFGFYLGRLMRFRPDVVADAIAEIVALWESGAVKPLVGATYPLDDVADAHRLSRNAAAWARLSSFRSALVTGGRSGIGAAIVSALERDGSSCAARHRDGFDAADPQAWEAVDRVDLACLNAGVVTGERLIARVERRAVPADRRRQRRRRRVRRPTARAA